VNDDQNWLAQADRIEAYVDVMRKAISNGLLTTPAHRANKQESTESKIIMNTQDEPIFLPDGENGDFTMESDMNPLVARH
jgi:hypothetical protein